MRKSCRQRETTDVRDDPARRLRGDDRIHVGDLEVIGKPVAEYFGALPTDERELGLIQAIEVGVFCLERASGVRDLDFVRSQVDGLLKAVERTASEIPGTVGEALLEKLGTEEGQALAPVRKLIDNASITLTERLNVVRDLLSDKIDPDSRSSTLGQALGLLKDLLDPARADSVQGSVAAAIRSVTGDDSALVDCVRTTVALAVGPLAEEINRLSKQLAADDAVEAALSMTPRKGVPYEESVVAELQAWVQATGAGLMHVGGDNRPGDVMIEFPESCVAGASQSVVVEARDRATPLGRKALAKILDEAMAERGATAGIYLSRSREGFAREIGEWAEGACSRGQWVATTHEHLLIAVRFLLAQRRIAALQEARQDIDCAAIEAQIVRARTALKRITNINRSVGAIRQQAGAIQDEGEALRSEIRDALAIIEDATRSTSAGAPA